MLPTHHLSKLTEVVSLSVTIPSQALTQRGSSEISTRIKILLSWAAHSSTLESRHEGTQKDPRLSCRTVPASSSCLPEAQTSASEEKLLQNTLLEL